MATSSTSAIGGSQIDVSGLASQLVTAERAPLDAQIARATTKATTQISALASLKSALSTFQTAMGTDLTPAVFSPRTAISADKTVYTATATASAAPGIYAIEVTQLAKVEQLSSKPVVGGLTQAIGTGTLTLTTAGKSFSVTIDSTKSTLAGIRDAINAAPDNSGIQATLIQADDGVRLVLSGMATGTVNGIVVAQSGGDGGLATLEYNSGLTTNYTELSKAQDSIVKVAGASHQSASNTVDGVLDGVTLTLLDQKPGTTINLTISQDTDTATARIKGFVTAYNALEAKLAGLRSYDATTQSGGPMLGDSLLSGLESQLRRTIGAPVSGVSGPYQSLSSIGITTQADGTLKVDDTKLQKALTSNFSGVAAIAGSSNGVLTQLSKQVTQALASNSAIDVRSTSLVRQQKDLTTRQAAIDARMDALKTQYIKQFTALDTLLSQLQTTSSYLTQQFDAISKISSYGK